MYTYHEAEKNKSKKKNRKRDVYRKQEENKNLIKCALSVAFDTTPMYWNRITHPFRSSSCLHRIPVFFGNSKSRFIHAVPRSSPYETTRVWVYRDSKEFKHAVTNQTESFILTLRSLHRNLWQNVVIKKRNQFEKIRCEDWEERWEEREKRQSLRIVMEHLQRGDSEER